MIRRKPLSTNEHGEPVLTIEVTGHHDIYRFAHHLLTGQSEFAAIGRKAIAAQKRGLGTAVWRRLDKFFGGDEFRKNRHESVWSELREAHAEITRLRAIIDVPVPADNGPAANPIGTVRLKPGGTVLAVLWPSPPSPNRWMVTDRWGSCGYETDKTIASWPVVGAMPFSPAAGRELTDPKKQKKSKRRSQKQAAPRVIDVHLPEPAEEAIPA